MAIGQFKTSVEEDRAELVKDLDTDHGADWRNQFAPGTFGCHELLDRLSLVAKLLEEAVIEHPACIQNADWYAKARLASDALNELYQTVGAEHL